MTKISTREWLLVLAPALVIAGFLGMRLARSPRDNAVRAQCDTRLKELGRAMALYSQDYNGHYPPCVVNGTRNGRGQNEASVGKPAGVGWADALSAEQKIPFNMYVCYGDKHSSGNLGFYAGKPGFTDYWMNGNLSGKPRSRLLFPNSTLLLGEGNDGLDTSNATYSKTSLPSLWLKDEKSPAHRHSGGANYLMADGAVHWLRPEEVTTFGGRSNAFALR